MKKYKVLISEQANLDIIEAKVFYRRATSDVRKRLKEDILLQTRKLQNRHYIHAIRYDNVRLAALQNFPFAFHYTINENVNTIHIFAFYHLATNPGNGPLRAAE